MSVLRRQSQLQMLVSWCSSVRFYVSHLWKYFHTDEHPQILTSVPHSHCLKDRCHVLLEPSPYIPLQHVVTLQVHELQLMVRWKHIICRIKWIFKQCQFSLLLCWGPEMLLKLQSEFRKFEHKFGWKGTFNNMGRYREPLEVPWFGWRLSAHGW